MGNHYTNNKNLDALVAHFGSKSKLARALKIKPQAVNDWRLKGRIPAGAAIKIETITDGKFLARDLVDGGVE